MSADDNAVYDALFEDLFHKHAPELAAFAFRMVKSRDVAEEIVQSVFLTLWEQRNTIGQRENIRAYLYTSVRRRALDVIKHENIVQSHNDGFLEDIPGHSAPIPSPQAQIEHAEMVRALEDAIAKLPDRARQIALLRWYDGLSYDEIATIMEITPKTVENQLRIAKATLKETLGGGWGFLTIQSS